MIIQKISFVYLSITVAILISVSCTHVIKTDQTTITPKTSANSISIGEQFTIYKMPYAYDHSIIYNSNDKKWHLYGIEAGNKTLFI